MTYMETSMDPINFDSFQAYQQYCQKLIREKLIPRFPDEDQERILELNTPFDWPAAQADKCNIGIMMIHGMYGSSFSMRDLGQCFVKKNIHARSLLLPGHCSQPADLCKVDLAESQATVKQQIKLFKQETELETIYLLGFSFGGLLALDYVNSQPDSDIAGLILLSPALGLQSPLTVLLPLADRIKPLKWYCKRKENDFTRYQSCAIHAAQQVNQLIKNQRSFNTMDLPKTFLSISLDDEVVCPQATIDFFNNIKAQEKQLILYGNECEGFEHENIIVRQSAFPEDNMVNASHINLIFAPENSHYGRNGTAPNLLYKIPPTKNKQTVYGSISKNNLQQYNVYRASYNPEFDYFAEQIMSFITA